MVGPEILLTGPVDSNSKLEEFTGLVNMRYLRISFTEAFNDTANEPNKLGMSIRNLHVQLDQVN